MYARHPTCPACSAYRKHMADLHRCWFQHHTGHHGLHPADVPPMPKPPAKPKPAIPQMPMGYFPAPPTGAEPPPHPYIDLPGVPYVPYNRRMRKRS